MPAEVATEVRRFYQTCLDKIVAAGLPPEQASLLLATITGAMLLANTLGDLDAYDRATRELPRLLAG